jgi:hypothetical protein
MRSEASSGAFAAFVIFVVGIGGCGAQPGSADAGLPTDASLPDLPPARVGRAGPEDGIDPTTARPADYGCLGRATAPPALRDATFSLEVDDFTSPAFIAGIQLCVHPDDQLPRTPSCDPPGMMLTTDAMGRAVVTAPAQSWMAIEVFAQDDSTGVERVTSLGRHYRTPNDGEMPRLNIAMASSLLDLIPVVTSAVRVMGAGVGGGSITDCNGTPVHGARFRLVRPDGTYLEIDGRRDGPRLGYFSSGLPVGTRSFTNIDGNFAAVNLPIEDGVATEYLVEAWARLTATSDPQLVGCESLLVRPDSISTTRLGPLRADGPSCPGISP